MVRHSDNKTTPVSIREQFTGASIKLCLVRNPPTNRVKSNLGFSVRSTYMVASEGESITLNPIRRSSNCTRRAATRTVSPPGRICMAVIPATVLPDIEVAPAPVVTRTWTVARRRRLLKSGILKDCTAEVQASPPTSSATTLTPANQRRCDVVMWAVYASCNQISRRSQTCASRGPSRGHEALVDLG